MSSEAQPQGPSDNLVDWQRDRKQITRAAGMITGAIIVGALYVASEVLIPITLAALLTFILAPLVNLLRRVGIPRVPAIVATVLLALGIIVGLGAVIGTQVADLFAQLPQYQNTLESKITKLRDTTLAPLSGAIMRFESHREQQPQSSPESSTTSSNSRKPLPVIVQQPPPSPVQVGAKVLGPILHPVATVVIMIVVTIFALLYREDIRDRAIRVFGSHDLSRTTSAMDDAGEGLSRYFIAQLAINAAFGVVASVGTYFIGLPHPILWGVMGGVLRFVPYIGAWLAAALPTLVAAAIEPGWSMALLTIGLYAITEFFAGQVLEPLLYGHSTGLSPIAVVIAAIFWTWLWGPIGLIISTPLTLCAVVLGRHIEQLSFIDILLGSRPALRPSESLYQRLLADNAGEAEEQLEELAGEHSLMNYYNNVAVEALQFASSDFRAGKLSHSDAERFRLNFEELIEFAQELGEKEDTKRGAGSAPSALASGAHILCLYGRGPFDGLAATILSQLIEREGIGATTSIVDASSREKLSSLEMKDVALICVVYLDTRAVPANARFLVRRLRQRSPDAKIVFGLVQKSALGFQEKLSKMGADDYASSLEDMLDAARAVTEPPAELARPANASRPVSGEAASVLPATGGVV
ncbi:AI-2E family transporter [Bradyrhizobium sp. STM 3562]|uniref:AI-2E family transporter n=1 Tax=Bradyrhizobium sp. STM 3562 TaxID=578924 RepID=UPI00388EC116